MWVRNWLLKRPKFGMYEKLMKHLRDGDTKSFRNFVRLGPEMFNEMVQELTPRIEKRRTPYREPLSTGLKLAVTLRYLATGDAYRSLSYGFRVAANTLVTVIPEVCQAIFDHYHDKVMKCPTTPKEWKDVADAFSEKWNFHHCCGAIDGKHVRIQAPPRSGGRYYNYKGYHSIIMLALVDANYKFLYVDVGAYIGFWCFWGFCSIPCTESKQSWFATRRSTCRRKCGCAIFYCWGRCIRTECVH